MRQHCSRCIVIIENLVQALVQGERFEKLAEGVSTVKALRELSKQYDVELPITLTLYMRFYSRIKCKRYIRRSIFKTCKI